MRIMGFSVGGMMKSHSTANATGQGHYGRLLLMLALSFVAMYILMYAMVNSFANVYNNVNQVYMAGLMAAPMGVIELALMGAMYPRQTTESNPYRRQHCRPGRLGR